MLPNADSGRLVVGEYLPPWLGKGSIKKKIWNFPDLVGGWVRKSPLSRFKKIKKYALKMHKNA